MLFQGEAQQGVQICTSYARAKDCLGAHVREGCACRTCELAYTVRHMSAFVGLFVRAGSRTGTIEKAWGVLCAFSMYVSVRVQHVCMYVCMFVCMYVCVVTA